MKIILKNKNSLVYEDFHFFCSIGSNGITKDKIEGDKKTPKGTYSLGAVYYREDRVQKPKTKLNLIKIKKNMGWCDDPSSKYYNKLIKVNNKLKFERMYRREHNYDLLIPIEYNTSKPIKYKGSAIFIHLTNNYKNTLGCISLKKKDFLILISLIKKKTKIQIV